MVFQDQAPKSRFDFHYSDTQSPLWEADWLKGNYS